MSIRCHRKQADASSVQLQPLCEDITRSLDVHKKEGAHAVSVVHVVVEQWLTCCSRLCHASVLFFRAAVRGAGEKLLVLPASLRKQKQDSPPPTTPATAAAAKAAVAAASPDDADDVVAGASAGGDAAAGEEMEEDEGAGAGRGAGATSGSGSGSGNESDDEEEDEDSAEIAAAASICLVEIRPPVPPAAAAAGSGGAGASPPASISGSTRRIAATAFGAGEGSALVLGPQWLACGLWNGTASGLRRAISDSIPTARYDGPPATNHAIADIAVSLRECMFGLVTGDESSR